MATVDNVENEEMTHGVEDPQPPRLLLCCQSRLVRFTLQNYFRDSGMTVSSVSGRNEGLEMLKRERFDAVITEMSSGTDESIFFRREIRFVNERIPILFLTPLFYWSDVRLLDRIVEDQHSYYIPENADRKFLLAKLNQVIHSYRDECSLNYLKSRVARNWFLASQLQKAMLPPWVYFGRNYEFSCFYRPFSKVSGDLFEWLPLDDDRALFIFGDISGHGTHAALAMTAVQSFLKQIIMADRERASNPSLIISDINDFFCNNLHNLVYMSALIAYVDFGENYLCYQNAGYMDLMCVEAATGETVNINPENRGSSPPGMIRDAVYTEEDNVEYYFTDTSVFLCFSDGLMDLSRDRNGDEYMDMEMCRELAGMLVAEAQKEEKSVAIPFRCYHSLEQFGYAHPQDDVSMVLIRKPRHPEDGYVFSCRVPADKKAVDELCQRASGFVAKCYNDEELSVNTELLLEEYLINFILHGLNEYEKLNEYIAVKLCAYPDALKLIVWDHGREWNGLCVHKHDADDILNRLNEDMAESGRGLPIIGKIASQISRERYSGLNESIFMIPSRYGEPDEHLREGA